MTAPRTSGALAAGYAGIVCDLDGVVYRGPVAVPHAVPALEAARGSGLRIAYATNNAARSPAQVADHLRELGLTLDTSAVVTSSQAGARHLSDRLDAGAPVLAVGGEGVGLALEEAGLTLVRTAALEEDPTLEVAAVLQGLGHDVRWRDLAQAAYAVQRGALWVVTNADTTVPTDRGTGPGNGALVGVVRHAVDVDPVVVGKPWPPLYELSARVLDTQVSRTLAIGDRLDTDLEGAVNTGMDGLFVLTGVSRLRDVSLADGRVRPTHLAVDLRALLEAYVHPTLSDGLARATCGHAAVRLCSGGFDVETQGDASHLLRCVVALSWAALDTDESPGQLDALRGVDDVAWQELERRILEASTTSPAPLAAVDGRPEPGA